MPVVTPAIAMAAMNQPATPINATLASTVAQATRTAKTLAFNELLRRTCAEEGYGWGDISSEVLGGDGVVATRFVRTDRDNHLDGEATYELWIRKLSVDKIGRATRTLSRRATAQSHDDDQVPE